tara:strand:- start:1054 stop:1500 length:447 start_codon:yes stop_codon:yes gene_type:complete
MSQYQVGSVLWIIHTDRPGLMAYQVIEEITKKTLDGEQIQYLVQAAVPNTTAIKLEKINGTIYENAEEAKQKMIENATRAIDGIVAKIQNNVDTHFGNQSPAESVAEKPKKRTPRKSKSKQDKLKPGYQWVTMENGVKAQVKIPETLK